MMSDRYAEALAGLAPTPPKKETLGELARLLERKGIDVAEIGRVQRINAWQAMVKNSDNEPEVVDLVGIQFSPAWEEGPKWPVIHPAKPVRLPSRPVVKRPADRGNWLRAMVWPDVQLGYFRSASGELEPIHDEAAIDVALQITRYVNPDHVALVGDNLDLVELGKYRVTPAYQLTTQPTIDRGGLLAAQLRQAAPNGLIQWLAGNHEERLPNYILDNARAAFGLRRANAPDSWPLMSVPELLRLDEHGVQYLPGYPASCIWLNERLKIEHGSRVTSNGSTAYKYLNAEKVSIIYGHIHRREWAEITRDDHDGPRTILAHSPGCLCRIDGAVPSTKGGTDLDGRPIVRHENWQQGITVIDFEPGDGRFAIHPIPIHDGWARWDGIDFHATVERNANVTV
jgi:hypothetical protein